MNRYDFTAPQLYHFKYGKEKLRLRWLEYENGRPAIVVEDMNGQLYAKLSVNMPEVPLGKNEYLIKTYAENTTIAEAIFKCGWFEYANREISSGFISLPVWRLRE